MAWTGIASGYELYGEDGTRAVVGNGAAAMADPDFVAYLDPESGIQGLLDTAAVRGSKTDLVEADGVSMGPSFQSGRSGTINGFFNANLDFVTISNQEARLKRATRALRGDGILRWTPYNDSSPRQIRFRRQDGPRISGRRPKTFQVTLDSPDVYALASSETSVVVTPGAPAGELGVSSPVTSPMTTSINVTAQQYVVNGGDAPTWPWFRVDGPITNPQILNNTSGEKVALAATLGVGEYVEIYPERGRILLNGTADRYSYLDFAQSAWFKLGAGSNDIRLLASSYSSPAQLTVSFRAAWE